MRTKYGRGIKIRRILLTFPVWHWRANTEHDRRQNEVSMADPTLETEERSNVIELAVTLKDPVEQKRQIGFEGLEDLEDTALDNTSNTKPSTDNMQLLEMTEERTNHHVELSSAIEGVSS